MQELEDKILRLLKEAKGNILDDEVLINTLNNSKLTAGMIQNRVREAEETEDSINQVRYLPCNLISCQHLVYYAICHAPKLKHLHSRSACSVMLNAIDCQRSLDTFFVGISISSSLGFVHVPCQLKERSQHDNLSSIGNCK